MATSTDVQGPVRKVFPFSHKPNTLDRDRIVVPAGWDSWGKIAVLRDGFEAKIWGDAWEKDLEGEEGQATSEAGAKKAYANLVSDQGPKVKRNPFQLGGCSRSLSSLHPYLPSTIPHLSKLSSPRITMKTPRSRTEILVGRLGTHKTLRGHQRVLWVL